MNGRLNELYSTVVISEHSSGFLSVSSTTSLPFIVYGAAPLFIPYDITSWSCSTPGFGFGRELFMLTNIFWTVLDHRNEG